MGACKAFWECNEKDLKADVLLRVGNRVDGRGMWRRMEELGKSLGKFLEGGAGVVRLGAGAVGRCLLKAEW